ncbi:hypothetical protein [Pimelobacter simplex]|uniref:hypothetical protein n=1 Tax=Nocardioides simplex TaxID=2045 RepID=UPI00214FBC0C|nr:hypothetical protein [Pimelobacter simplex]UUW92662.1 hypothetical protein M0M43_14620 [Pimelobacter simplex]UUW96490.1 hypothetical protein M0M48_03255 [Pimelobacter simplex]
MIARTLAFVAVIAAVIAAGLILATRDVPEPAPAPPKWDEIPVCLYECGGSVPA